MEKCSFEALCDVTIGIAELHLVGCNMHKQCWLRPLKTPGFHHVKDEKSIQFIRNLKAGSGKQRAK